MNNLSPELAARVVTFAVSQKRKKNFVLSIGVTHWLKLSYGHCVFFYSGQTSTPRVDFLCRILAAHRKAASCPDKRAKCNFLGPAFICKYKVYRGR